MACVGFTFMCERFWRSVDLIFKRNFSDFLIKIFTQKKKAVKQVFTMISRKNGWIT